ncbi:MAG: response regulator [Elainellaceae cyanobacterium]
MLNKAVTSLAKNFSKILIVDDSIDNLRFLANILTEQGYQVRKVLNGHMALTAAKTSPPDLVILDINMPQLSGYEVCQALKADPATAAIPVIFVSALDDVLDRVRAYTVGGVDYISKPFQFEEVIARVGTQIRLQSLTQHVAIATERGDRADGAYQTLFEQGNQGMYQLNIDGTYRQVNPAIASLLGYASGADMVEKLENTPQSLYVDPEQWLTLVETICEQPSRFEAKADVYRADGSIIQWSERLYLTGQPSDARSEQSAYYLGLIHAVG